MHYTRVQQAYISYTEYYYINKTLNDILFKLTSFHVFGHLLCENFWQRDCCQSSTESSKTNNTTHGPQSDTDIKMQCFHVEIG